MAKRVAINGFGRIGRLAARVALNMDDVEIVAVNDLGDKPTMAHLLRYDSIHGKLHGVEVTEKGFKVAGREILALCEKDAAKLPWKDLKIDVVIESTGVFTSTDKAKVHLDAGAKKVVISAPAKGDPKPPTFVFGVNDDKYNPATDHIVSAASCTTNCLAPVARVLHDNFGIEHGLMTTIHSYTNDQRILDLPHKDLRRARAAAMSIIPTSTGAAKAVGLVLPALKGKLDGYALRVPTPDVSVVDLTVRLGKAATRDEINAAMKAAAEGALKGVLHYTTEPLVSTDYIGTTWASVFDSELTNVVDGRMAKVVAWYDNEFGFTNQLLKLVRKL